jgi:Transposase DDE domain
VAVPENCNPVCLSEQIPVQRRFALMNRFGIWLGGASLALNGIRKTIKNHLMPRLDKILLQSRFISDTMLNKLKSTLGIEHPRHRSPVNDFVHVLSCLVAFAFKTSKPKINTTVCRQAWP